MSDLPTLYAHPWTLDHNLDKLVPLSRTPIDGKPNIPYVPAARLEEANLEIERLKALLAEGVGLHNESSPDCTCTFNVRARAALTPKEPSDG